MVKVKNKSSKSDQLRVKKVIKKVLNPFEVHINKEKIKVLGRKTKNDKGLPGIARAKAMKKRKNTLGQEFALRHKSNKFVDRRIGERNSAMTAEDRITARFTAEQQRLHGNKRSIYNLEDTVLTHRGQTLSEIEKFEDPRSEDEFSDDESGQRGGGRLEANFVADAHFGGGLFKKSGEEGARSRKELIEQLIVESKKRKFEKQKLREATIEMTEKLDSEWKDLLPLVNTSKAPKEQEIATKSDDYDIVMRQLKFEARGTPSDRLKSEDEIAIQEREKLEQLENDRLSRMNSGSDEKTNKKKHRSADDLDDGLYIETETDFTLKYSLDGKLMNEDHFLGEDSQKSMNDEVVNFDKEDSCNNESESDDDDDDADAEVEDGDDDSLSDLKADDTSSDEMSQDDMDAQSNTNNVKEVLSPNPEAHNTSGKKRNHVEDDSGSHKAIEVDHNDVDVKTDCDSSPKLNCKDKIKKDDSSNARNTNSDEVVTQKIKEDLLNRKKVMEKAAKELPYTFKTPNDYEELEKLLSKMSPDHQSIIIQRMIKCNHPSLNDGNKEKLGTLLAYLLQYINDVFSDISQSTVQNKFLILDRLMPYMYDLCQMNPGNAYTCFMEVIKEKQSDYRKRKTAFPGLDTLVFFKLISVLFPTSDFRHQVVTPALAFMSQMLSRCKVRTKTDIASGLFLVTLVLEYCVLSKRILPAALNFIAGIIHMTIPKNSVQILKIIRPFKSGGVNSSLLVLEDSISEVPDECQLILTSLDFVEGALEESDKLRIFYIALKMLDEFYMNLNVLDAADALFKPFFDLLPMIPVDNYPPQIKSKHEETYALIQQCKNSMKEFLRLETARPKALRLYEPNIEKILYDTKRHRPMSKDKAEHEKLLHKYKREMKGALREIRRDKSYLAGLQIKKQIASDVERKAKVKQIYAEAAVQQGELNSLKRMK